jgi:hypothetical protein
MTYSQAAPLYPVCKSTFDDLTDANLGLESTTANGRIKPGVNKISLC